MTSQGSDIGSLILLTLRDISREMDKRSRRLMKEYGLTIPQLLVIKHLTETGPQTVGALANAINLSQATTTSVLDRMQAGGYVARSRDTVDKRRVFVYPTEKTRAIAASNPSILQEEFYRKLDELESWEQTQLLSALQRLASMLETESVPKAP